MGRRATWVAWLALSAGVFCTGVGRTEEAKNEERGTKIEDRGSKNEDRAGRASDADAPSSILHPPSSILNAPSSILEKMADAPRSRIRPVVEQATLTARGPVEVFPCTPETYFRLLDHPDRASQTWRKLGAQCVPISDRGQGRFGWADAHGSDLLWETVFRDARTRVWYATGKVRPAALVPLVSVQAVLVLHHVEGHDRDGHALIRQSTELFVHTDSKTAAWVTKMLGASGPKMAEQYLGQIEMFFSALAWYLDAHPERADLVNK